MRYYVIAGERSGDLHAGNLIKALKLHDPKGEFKGFGGNYMQEAGATLTVHYRNLAFMGFIEVLKNLNTIKRYIKQCKADIIAYKPDVVILVDYGGFNLRIAKFCKSINQKVFYYITPKVWAWNQGRAYKLKANIDRAFVILPFEKTFFNKFDWQVDYVGNPVLDAVKAHTSKPKFLEQHNFNTDQKLVALLPGSRKQELLNMIPIMTEVVKLFPKVKFAVAAVNNLSKELYGELNRLDNVTFLYEETYDLLLHADAAVVTSGTATLETALFKVPQVVVYKTSTSTYWIVKLLIKVPYISLVNLIADKEVVKELIQHAATAENIVSELGELIDGARRDQVLQEYEEIIKILDTGSASENAARLMTHYLKQ